MIVNDSREEVEIARVRRARQSRLCATSLEKIKEVEESCKGNDEGRE